MTPVDVDRLRKQLPIAREWWAQGEQLRICDAAEAVLDARNIWWCENAGKEGRPEVCSDVASGHVGCCWVALVPVDRKR